jgi:hypothetical protein
MRSLGQNRVDHDAFSGSPNAAFSAGGADVPEFAMKPTVYVVDDDAGTREALDEMLTLAGMGVVTCASASDYFRVPKPDLPSCLIKGGAIDFLTKPCRKRDLLAAIESAIKQDRRVRAEKVERMRLKYLHSCLTPRDRKSCRSLSVDCSTSRPPPSSASAKPRYRFTAAASCARWRPNHSLSWSAWRAN